MVSKLPCRVPRLGYSRGIAARGLLVRRRLLVICKDHRPRCAAALVLVDGGAGVGDGYSALQRPVAPQGERSGRGRLAALEAAARRELASARGRGLNIAGNIFGRK